MNFYIYLTGYNSKTLEHIVLETRFQLTSLFPTVASSRFLHPFCIEHTRFSEHVHPRVSRAHPEVWRSANVRDPRWRDKAGHNREPATCLRPASRMRLQSHGTPGSSVRSSLATRPGRFSLAPLDRPSGLRRLSFSLSLSFLSFLLSLFISLLLSLLLFVANVKVPHRIRARAWFSNSTTRFSWPTNVSRISRSEDRRRKFAGREFHEERMPKRERQEISRQTILIVDPRRESTRVVRCDRFRSDASVVESCDRSEWSCKLLPDEIVRRRSRDAATVWRQIGKNSEWTRAMSDHIFHWLLASFLVLSWRSSTYNLNPHLIQPFI